MKGLPRELPALPKNARSLRSRDLRPLQHRVRSDLRLGPGLRRLIDHSATHYMAETSRKRRDVAADTTEARLWVRLRTGRWERLDVRVTLSALLALPARGPAELETAIRNGRPADLEAA